MIRIKQCLKNMGAMISILIMGLAFSLLTGCSHQTTVTEGATYLQAQVQQAQIQAYKMHMKSTQDRLTQVIPQVSDPNPVLPPSMAGELAQFLLDNDCTAYLSKPSSGDPVTPLAAPSAQREQMRTCIQNLQVRLIRTSRSLETEQVNNYAAKVTINQLIANIHLVSNSLDDAGDGKTLLGIPVALPSSLSAGKAP